MRLILITVFTILLFNESNAQRKQVCFTIDDLPFVPYGMSDTALQHNMVLKLVNTFKENKIPAIGFVNEMKLYERGETIIPLQVRFLQHWIDAGLELGNHSYSHMDYHLKSFKSFSQDVLKGEIITRKILRANNDELKYFRHPYLHAGNSKGKYDSLNAFLTQQNYTVAPVTIDNEDYLFALAYKRAWAKHDSILMKRIGNDYIDYMQQKVKYFEQLSNSLYKRNVKQILLFHASQLNADYSQALATMFINNGYEFTSLAEALEDPVYKTPVTVYGSWGISWLERWALSEGKKGDLFKDDPATPEYVKKLAE